jgi:beta-glucosidase
MWYLGQETGHSITDVLFGDVSPSGKLPTTFPRRIEDNPTHIYYPGENGKVRYGEGIFVGYRYYDKKDIDPLFPFGHGLSYTTFEYSDLRPEKETFSPGENIQVQVSLKNSGSRPGKEVVQLYLRDMESSLMRPDKELKAFAKIDLNPGELKDITFTLDQNALAFYNDVTKRWEAELGEFEVLVGGSSRDIRLKCRFKLEGLEANSTGSSRLSVGSPLRLLLEDEGAAAILQKHLDDILDMQDLVGYSDYSLEKIHKFEPRGVTIAMLKIIQEDLDKL